MLVTKMKSQSELNVENMTVDVLILWHNKNSNRHVYIGKIKTKHKTHPHKNWKGDKANLNKRNRKTQKDQRNTSSPLTHKDTD